jgi:organic radical activating enzyme
MKLVEVFPAIQGEGKTVGQARLLLRVPGCNLRCSWCDTKYATTKIKSEELNPLSRYTRLFAKHSKWMITGGEPMLYQTQLLPVLEKYSPDWLEVETSGTLPVSDPVLFDFVDLWNISPKRETDQVDGRNTEPKLLTQIPQLKDYILKFVFTATTPTQTEEFLQFIVDIGEKYGLSESELKERTWIMPHTNKAKFLNDVTAWEFALKNGFNYSDRLHVRVFGPKRGI